MARPSLGSANNQATERAMENRTPLYVRAREPMPRSERGRLGARKRWGDEPRTIRLADLTPDQKRLVLALLELGRHDGASSPGPQGSADRQLDRPPAIPDQAA